RAALATAWCTGVGEKRILSKTVRDFNGTATVGGVVNVHRRRAAQNIAVVAPDHHLFSVDFPGNYSWECVEIPAGEFRVLGRVRDVVRAIRSLDNHLPIALQVVRAQVELRPGGEE